MAPFFDFGYLPPRPARPAIQPASGSWRWDELGRLVIQWTAELLASLQGPVLQPAHLKGDVAGAKELAQAALQLFEALGDSHYLPDPQLLLARIALDEGECGAAEALSSAALAHYESRGDVVLTAAAWLVQADLVWRMGRPDEAETRYRRAQSLRATVKRPISPRERARAEALERRLLASN